MYNYKITTMRSCVLVSHQLTRCTIMHVDGQVNSLSHSYQNALAGTHSLIIANLVAVNTLVNNAAYQLEIIK